MKYPHLFLTLRCREQLAPELLVGKMEALVRAIGMTPVEPAIVFCKEHPWGPSVLQPLAESHAIAHYWDQDRMFVDIFSCRSFDIEVATEFVMREFKGEELLEQTLLWRGP